MLSSALSSLSISTVETVSISVVRGLRVSVGESTRAVCNALTTSFRLEMLYVTC